MNETKPTLDDRLPAPPVCAPFTTERSDRTIAIILFCALLTTFAYFIDLHRGWNDNSRLCLTCAIVEQHTFAIDSYHDLKLMQTGDKAYFKGHYYCDKSPGLSFLAVPAYWILWQAKMNFGWFAEHPQSAWIVVALQLVIVGTVGICAAAVGVLVWLLARRFCVSSGLAIVLSLVLLCGTLLFGYATVFFPYLPSMLFFMGSYAILLDGRLKEAVTPCASPSLARGSRLFCAGLLLGLGWLCDYTVGLLGIGLGCYALWSVRRQPWAILKFVLAGLIPVALFFAYAHSIFGEFSIPYKYEYNDHFREEMAKGFQGIHWPRLSVLYYITIHPFRGLFFYSPVLLLWFPAVVFALRAPRFRRYMPDTLLSIYVVIAYFAFGAGYYLWWGGSTACNRNLCPAVPFFLAPLALYLSTGARTKTRAFVILAAVSILMHLMITAVEPLQGNVPDDIRLMNPKISENYPSPILNERFPRFVRGQLNANLGLIFLNLEGLWSLTPLAVMWLLAAAWILRLLRGSRDG